MWKQHPTFTKYEVSKLGEVRRISSGKILSQRKGYKYHKKVNLYDNSNCKHVRTIHSLVAETWMENPDKLHVLHIDESLPEDRVNSLSNLTLGTDSDNIKDAVRKMRWVRTKYSMDERRRVVAMRDLGLIYREISDITGITMTSVTNICQRREAHGL